MSFGSVMTHIRTRLRFEPVKKCSDSVVRSKRKEEWVRNEGPIECELRLHARGGVELYESF